MTEEVMTRRMKKNARIKAFRKTGEEHQAHHRLPESRGGTNEQRNISIVPKSYHDAWHHLFGNMTAEEVAQSITDTWICPDFYFIAVPRKRKKQRGRRCRRYCDDCECVVLQNVPRKV